MGSQDRQMLETVSKDRSYCKDQQQERPIYPPESFFSVPTSRQKVGNFGQRIPAQIDFCFSSTESKLGKEKRRRVRQKRKNEGGREEERKATIH